MKLLRRPLIFILIIALLVTGISSCSCKADVQKHNFGFAFRVKDTDKSNKVNATLAVGCIYFKIELNKNSLLLLLIELFKAAIQAAFDI